MEVTTMEGKLMTKGADGQMMEVAMGDKAMAEGEAMAEGDMAMEGAMMGNYVSIENPDIIEPGWILCIPTAEDAQKLLSGEMSTMDAMGEGL
jgi:hypothetical protein